jgi:DNA-binding NarL/FixJ family response regulator
MEAALENLAHDLPDVLLIDLGLPGMSGMDGIRRIRGRWPGVVMLTLTVHEESSFIFESLCAGADGYLLKSTQPAELIRCIHEAIQGGAPMSPAIAKKVITLFRRARPVPEEANELTAHELRILKLLASGENYKSSAKLLGVSVNTISYHVRSIYTKLHVHSRGDAVAKALRRGLIT